jgi:UDPglucose 6-dehydrogenase
MPNVKALLGDDVRFCENPYDAVQGADFLIIATEWPEFRTPDFAKLSSVLKSKVIFDGRNVFENETMRKHGYRYVSIGREDVKPA